MQAGQLLQRYLIIDIGRNAKQRTAGFLYVLFLEIGDTVFDDGEVDILDGGDELDLFFAALNDVIAALENDEIIVD